MSEEIYINTGNTFQQTYTARVPANAQTPVSARQPARQPAQGRTPFTYQNRSPFTYRNPVSGQQPYIANAQAPYPYIANSQTPYIANAQQPYPYIANGQQPYIANAQSPFTYNARSPFTYNATGRTPFTYNNRSPFTYTRQGRSPFTYSAQTPFTYQARTPFTYQASARASVSQQQPAIGRQPYIYTAATTRVDDFGGQSYELYDYNGGGAGVELTLYAHRTALNNTIGDIVVQYSLNAGGSDWSEYLYLGTSLLWSYDSYEGITGTHPGQPAYTIEDTFADTYTVRRTHSNTSGDGLTAITTPVNNYSITTTAQALYYWGGSGGRRAVMYTASDPSGYVSGSIAGSLIFETSSASSFSYTYSFTFDYSAENEENDCPQCCIHEDMLVATSDGDKHINDLKSGDFIYGYNFETDQKELTMINGIKKLERGRIVTVNNTIVTDDHPIFLIDGSLASTNPEATLKNYHKEVKRLEVGDKILDVNNNHVLVETIEPYAGEHKVYTIKTVLDNFYADNILVDSVLQTPKHRMEGTWSQNH